MKKLNTKSKVLVGIVMCIFAIAIILIILYFNHKNSSVLFRFSHENYAWSPTSYGYSIYSNGIIEEYDDYNEDEELKKAKITNEELNKLKELANKVEDKYEKNDKIQLFDAGTSTRKIYSDRLGKWIILSKGGDSMGKNNTETSIEILEFVEELKQKYLGE